MTKDLLKRAEQAIVELHIEADCCADEELGIDSHSLDCIRWLGIIRELKQELEKCPQKT